MIVDRLIEIALEKADNRKVADICLGLGYTGVVLEDGSAGLAYTFRNELGNCCGAMPDAGNLIGKSSAELIPWVREKNLLKAAVGLSVINAVLNRASDPWEDGNVVNAIQIKPSETFGMVGKFSPILRQVKNMTKQLFVFERQIEEGSGVYPADTIPLHLPHCDVVVITATSILNHSIDDILTSCTNAREVCIVGPSTPHCPQVFQDTPVTLLAGSIVIDAKRILPILSQGGGTKEMRPALRHVLQRI